MQLIEEESHRRKRKGRRCWLGDVLDCRTRDWVARMIWRKVFGRTSILRGVVVWCGWWTLMIIHFCKSSIHPFFYVSFSANHPGAKSLKTSPNQQQRLLLCFCKILWCKSIPDYLRCMDTPLPPHKGIVSYTFDSRSPVISNTYIALKYTGLYYLAMTWFCWYTY